ncbi:hypothetical protein N180_10590 [Pedobacter antarcticus 4BY]|uniref:Dihydrolipoamide dehydrogenase n=2 Tax=Pedobacter antarcticus TaxID=34086 RepID=A0A081PJB4_9SPHI|nr:DUF2911 domain-containing protein [Pedobacter antarcticus]KEQ30787.1 hypothetical protein N180_10590 [Pedobacter antarcticus 4BY]SFE92645.1 Protein of unknown function [Pedobacter antarcticus]
MKTMLKTTLALLLAAGLNYTAVAQGISLPQPSSGQTVIQDFGLGKITVKYSRPNTKGREIFGALEPYGQVWRTGANNATSITFTEDISLEGKKVPAGEYALFTIPGKNEWTIILNKTVKQWGSYEYKEADDVIRIKVKPVTLKDKTETFSINFTDVYPTKATLQLLWGSTMVPVKLTTDIDARVMASIDEAMKGDKKPYFQAAQYYFENGKDLNKTLEWMNAAETADPKAPWVKLWKGRVQLKMGDKKGAAETAQAGIKLSTELNNPEYIRLNTGLLEETKK